MNRPAIMPPVPNPLRQQVTDNLRAAIANLEFEPGGRLTERALCESLGVSRSTVRESLRQLESEGLVRITPNKGPVITSLTAREARDIYAIRERLESYAVSLCAELATPEVVQGGRARLTAIRSAVRVGDYAGLQVAKTAYYEFLFGYTGNTQLSLLVRQLRARCALTRATDRLRTDRMAESLRGAEEIFAAIKVGDPGRAAGAASTHIQRAAALALAALHPHGDLTHAPQVRNGS